MSAFTSASSYSWSAFTEPCYLAKVFCRFHDFLVELNKRDSASVIKHVDSKTMAINSAVVVEYLKALVKTDQISQFSQAGVVRYSSHPFWLNIFELVLLTA